MGRIKMKWGFTIGLIAVMLFAAGGAWAADWYVDDSVGTSGDGTSWATAFKTIQEGVTAANAAGGDTINVAAGTYDLTTTLTINKAVTVSGPETGDPAIINGSTLGGSTDVVSITANSVTVSYMNITAGLDNDHGDDLIDITGHDAKIEHCKIYGAHNKLIYLHDAEGTIIDHCEIYDAGDNIIRIKGDNTGNTIEIKNSIIQHGDGIYISEGGSNILIENNVLSGLHSWPHNPGEPDEQPFPWQNAKMGIATCGGENVVIKNNLIYAFSQAGIKLESNNCTIENNTIAFCYEWASGASKPILLQAQAANAKYGFGIRIKTVTGATIRNNILAYNYRGIGIYPGYGGPAAASTIEYNNIFGGDTAGLTALGLVQGGDWQYEDLDDVVAGYTWDPDLAVINTNWQAGQAGNLEVDPEFVTLPDKTTGGGDYHLQSTAGSYHGGAWTADGSNSPCIDAGDPSSDYSNEPYYNGGRINMGAYGNTEQASKSNPPPSDVWVDDSWTCQADVDAFDPSLTWQYDAFNTIQDGIDAVEGSTVNVRAGTYTENVTIAKSLTLKACSNPVIDPGAGTAVTIDASNVTITGFTIQNAATGILVSSGTNNAIHFCDIVNNNTWGLNNTSGNLVDAENNWWGDAGGPDGTNNPNGTPTTDGGGDAIGDYVDADPWLGADVEDSKTEDISGTGGTIPADESPSGGAVTVTGAGLDTILTVVKYAANPGGATTFNASGDYWDVHLSNDTGVDSVTVNFCPANPGDTIYYWDGSDWVACSDQVYGGGCITVTITDATNPDISDLTGLPFARGTSPSAIPSAIPTLSEWGMIILFLLTITAGFVVIRRRRA